MRPITSPLCWILRRRLDARRFWPHLMGMKRLALIALLTPFPAMAEDGPSMMERGLRMFMEGLMDEMEPALRDLEDLTREAGPLMKQLERDLGQTLESMGDSLNAYHPPEILPNGDIIIRRRDPLPEVDRNSDGSVDL